MQSLVRRSKAGRYQDGTVGEQLSTASGEVTSTGVVQANSYRETPVVSIAGGIVRRVTRELGENVERGQTITVVFSNEFAEAQSRYLTLLTESKNGRRNYDRAEKLVVINQPGRSEFEQATRQLKAAEASLDEMKKRYQRTVKLVQIGASSRQDLEQDTTKLRTAEAESAEMQLRLNRSKQLLEINPQTRAELEESGNKLQSAESDLASARQKLLLYGCRLPGLTHFALRRR